MSGVTYAKAGVDIDEGNLFVAMIRKMVAAAWQEDQYTIGEFAGRVAIPEGTTFVSGSTDGTGTKAIVAALAQNFDGLGQDAVAMGAVDAYCAGYRPIAVLDTLDVAVLQPKKHIAIIRSVIHGCKFAGGRLIGGETAELPDMFRHDWMVNLNVSVIGIPDDQLQSPRPPQPGDIVFGWPSGGVCSNGFSLVRKVLGLTDRPSRARERLNRPFPEFGIRQLSTTLLKPTPIWIREVDLALKYGVVYVGHAHITGGGLVDNIPRALPNDCRVVLKRNLWERPPIFRLIQNQGNVAEAEMDRTFNQGIIMVSFADPKGLLTDAQGAIRIGTVRRRKGEEPQVQFTGTFKGE